MTGLELLTNAVALMGGDFGESAVEEYASYAVPSINLMYADLFDINNSLLLAGGDSPLTAIPTMDAPDEEIAYHDRLTRNAMVYGLARDLARGEGHPAIGAFARLYDENRLKYSVGVSTAVTDCYASAE